MFQSTIILKGTSAALLVSCQIQTLASPWSISIVPKSGVLFTGRFFCSPEGLEYITRCHIRQRYRPMTPCVSYVSSKLSIAITFKGAESGAHQRRSRGLSGQAWRGWVWKDLIFCASASTGEVGMGLKAVMEGFHGEDISQIKMSWEVDRGVCFWLVLSWSQESHSHAQ